MAAAIDPSIDPCQDFYQYACGRWKDSVAFPAVMENYASDNFLRLKIRNQYDIKFFLGLLKRLYLYLCMFIYFASFAIL